MKIKSKEISFRLLIAESTDETRNGLFGVVSEDVHRANDFLLLTGLITNWKNIDERQKGDFHLVVRKSHLHFEP